MTDIEKENQQLWNEWSDDFQALWNANTSDGDLPPAPCPFTSDAPGGAHPDILPSVEGVDFVELGCGGGQASVGTAMEGAETVVGIDFSPEQLRHARKLRDLYGVEAQFIEGDVTNLPFQDDAFDVAFSGWVFQMVSDLDQGLAEAHRVLREDGVFVLGLPHPVHELFDPETKTLERSYHGDSRREITIDEEYESELTVFDRKVSDVHNALVDAGFDVRRILEPGSTDADEDEDSDDPDLTELVPRRLRFWATVR